MTIEISLLESVSAQTCAEFWHLYEHSFPAEEREPKDIILKGLESGRAYLLAAWQSEHLVGFINFQLLHDPHSLFIVYIVVDETRRGQRMGDKLIQAAETFVRERFPGILWPVWAEIETLEGGKTEREQQGRRKRARFFERLMFEANDVSYIQPPVDGHSLVPMCIISKPKFASNEISGHLQALLFQKYGAINGISYSILTNHEHIQKKNT